ncbi:unnamed protein product [Pedinophyceae sp. YPF-701]|nr:unnamed protein product [Pedinophyceae sp. YPF-701]
MRVVQQEAVSWQYEDPNRIIQGPFDASRMLTWQGKYPDRFTANLSVRRLGDRHWQSLDSAIQSLQADASFHENCMNAMPSGSGVIHVAQAPVQMTVASSAPAVPHMHSAALPLVVPAGAQVLPHLSHMPGMAGAVPQAVVPPPRRPNHAMQAAASMGPQVGSPVSQAQHLAPPVSHGVSVQAVAIHSQAGPAMAQEVPGAHGHPMALHNVVMPVDRAQAAASEAFRARTQPQTSHPQPAAQHAQPPPREEAAPRGDVEVQPPPPAPAQRAGVPAKGANAVADRVAAVSIQEHAAANAEDGLAEQRKAEQPKGSRAASRTEVSVDRSGNQAHAAQPAPEPPHISSWAEEIEQQTGPQPQAPQGAARLQEPPSGGRGGGASASGSGHRGQQSNHSGGFGSSRGRDMEPPGTGAGAIAAGAGVAAGAEGGPHFAGAVEKAPAARKLFTAGCTRVAEQPVWWYTGEQDRIQGPFLPDDMAKWFTSGFLPPDLGVAATDRSVNYPLRPAMRMFAPLKQLIQETIKGKTYSVYSLRDVQVGEQDGDLDVDRMK